jgi:hypothetical protein
VRTEICAPAGYDREVDRVIHGKGFCSIQSAVAEDSAPRCGIVGCDEPVVRSIDGTAGFATIILRT